MFDNEVCDTVDKSGKPIRIKCTQLTKNSPQQLLKCLYPGKTLSASAMLVFGAPAIQKIGSKISGKPMGLDKAKDYEDEYYSDARDTLDDFIQDLDDDDVKAEYVVNNDWSWDKKTSQRRGKNRNNKKTKEPKKRKIEKEEESNNSFDINTLLKDHNKSLQRLTQKYEGYTEISSFAENSNDELLVGTSESVISNVQNVQNKGVKRRIESKNVNTTKNIRIEEDSETQYSPVIKRSKDNVDNIDNQVNDNDIPQKKSMKFDFSKIDISKYMKFPGSEFEPTNLEPPSN